MLLCIFRANEGKLRTGIRPFWKWALVSAWSQKAFCEDGVPPLWDRGRFPAAFWPHPPDGWHVVRICPFVTAPGDKQQQAGWKGDFLRSAAKLSLAAASQLPARSDLWALGWDGTGRGKAPLEPERIINLCCFVPKFTGWAVLCWGLGVALDLGAAFLCSSERRRLSKCGLGGCVPALAGLDVEITEYKENTWC